MSFKIFLWSFIPSGKYVKSKRGFVIFVFESKILFVITKRVYYVVPHQSKLNAKSS